MDNTDPKSVDSAVKNRSSQGSTIFQQDIMPGAVVQQSLVSGGNQKGDLYVGLDGVRFTRIPVGTTDQFLKVSNGTPVWSDPPATSSDWNSTGDSWSYSSVDGATGVVNIPSDGTNKYSVGMRIKFTQTTVKYFIVTAVTSTTLTLYGGTDYTLANAAISSISYSTVKLPFNFPADLAKWTVRVTNNANELEPTPTNGTWYNTGTTASQITVPIGSWRLSYWGVAYTNLSSGTTVNSYFTLSTANNSESDTQMSCRMYALGATAVCNTFTRTKFITISSKTIYYFIWKSAVANTANLGLISADGGDMVLEAVCAYF